MDDVDEAFKCIPATGATTENEGAKRSSWATPEIIHEVELPNDLTKEHYNTWYALSWIEDGVRVGPRPPSMTAIGAAHYTGDAPAATAEGEAHTCLACGATTPDPYCAECTENYRTIAAVPPVETPEGHTVECDGWIYPNRPCTCKLSDTATPHDAARETAREIVQKQGDRLGNLSFDEVVAIVSRHFPPTAPAESESKREAERIAISGIQEGLRQRDDLTRSKAITECVQKVKEHAEHYSRTGYDDAASVAMFIAQSLERLSLTKGK